jgi:anti-sigma factor RsiW
MHDHKECTECRQFLEILSDYHDGELDEELVARFELHMSECERCQAVVRTFRQTIVYYRTTRCKAVPRDVHSGLITALRACIDPDD